MVILAANQFTQRLTVCRISFTLEFKNLFLAKYESGETVRDIFTELGYDTDILGENRMYNFANRLLNQVEQGKLPTEVPANSAVLKPVNVDYNTMPAQKSVSAMQREIAYLRQQVEFLKKLSEAVNGRKPST